MSQADVMKITKRMDGMDEKLEKVDGIEQKLVSLLHKFKRPLSTSSTGSEGRISAADPAWVRVDSRGSSRSSWGRWAGVQGVELGGVGCGAG